MPPQAVPLRLRKTIIRLPRGLVEMGWIRSDADARSRLPTVHSTVSTFPLRWLIGKGSLTYRASMQNGHADSDDNDDGGYTNFQPATRKFQRLL